MFGIDSPELLVIAIVALIVIGPKELPGLLKSWGAWMAKMRGMAAEFRGHVDEMVRQSDLDEVKKQLTASPGLDLQSLDPTKEIKSHFEAGIAEGEKAIAEAKSSFDSPLAEPDSAPQIGVEPAPETTSEAAVDPVLAAVPAADYSAVEPVTTETMAAEAPPVDMPAAAEPKSEPAPPKVAAAG